MTNYITRTVRKYFTEKDSNYVFRRTDGIRHSNIRSINLYIHIPFCKNLCPYCPYFKIKYDSQKVPAYLKAILNEVEMYYNFFGKIDIPSIYVGGGTPTLVIDELDIILKHIRAKFNVIGDTCIEINPNDITGEIVSKLKDNNVNSISVGAQSFLDKHLNFIGRKYRASEVNGALDKLVKAGFGSVNIDLLFALPKQSVGDVIYDLDKAIESGVKQITTYPLFTFPYTTIGRYLKLKKVKMPNLFKRHRQYYLIHKYLSEKGFKRVSVWGFKKGDVPRYSSVTRDQYIGLGAGAGSHLPDGFYLNTFSVEEYIKKCTSNKFPVALYMGFTNNMQKYFWLYWRFYDTYISKKELGKKFGLNDKKLNRLFTAFRQLRLLQENDTHYELTIHGAFWIHLMQNLFSLRYIDKIWNMAMKEKYPSEIVL